MIPAVITEIRQATPTIKTLLLTPTTEFSFKAGQWLDCFKEIGEEKKVAGYSMTSSPLNRDFIELAVKNVGENPVTRYIHSTAKVGDVLKIDGGHGEVFFNKGMAAAVYLIAGGIGIAPHMSIFRYIDKGDLNATCTLLYSVSSLNELLFKQEIEKITRSNSRMSCYFTVTEDTEGWSGLTGKIDVNMVKSTGIDPNALYYICGPPSMIHELVGILRTVGIRRKQMRYELWW